VLNEKIKELNIQKN